MNASQAISIALQVGCMCRPKGIRLKSGENPWHGVALEVSDTCFWLYSALGSSRAIYHPKPPEFLGEWEIVSESTIKIEESNGELGW